MPETHFLTVLEFKGLRLGYQSFLVQVIYQSINAVQGCTYLYKPIALPLAISKCQPIEFVAST